MKNRLRLRDLISIFLFAVTFVVLIWLTLITWMFRDGLGPDSVESQGYEAVARFAGQFWPIGLLALFLFSMAVAIGLPKRNE